MGYANWIERVAKKSHWCELCGARIPKRQRYISASCVSGDGWYRWKMHKVCASVTRNWDQYDWEVMEQCSFIEELRDAYCPARKEHVFTSVFDAQPRQQCAESDTETRVAMAVPKGGDE